MNPTILIIAALFSGLIAGLFYSWSISVTPGIGRLNDENYLRAFQAMNRAILNPVFFIAFFGLAILSIYLGFISINSEMTQQNWFVLLASFLYLVGIMFVTIFGNIPLNNGLEALQIDKMTAEQMELFRDGFETKWNRLNLIRTISSSLSLLFFILACIQQNNI